jgi:HAD superfamily hydrolase (TIGR01509 family)
MSGPYAVGFDIDHTLCIDNKLERVAFLHLLERLVADGGTPLGSLAHESDHIDVLLAWQRGGAATIEEAVRTFVRERGVEPREEYVEGFKRMAVAMAETFIVPDPQARTTIAALERAGVPVAVLSNGWNPLQVTKARRAGFDGRVIASADLGAQKPHAAAFEELARELGTDPARCFYVGDDPRADVAGALAAGFQAVWLDHEGKNYPADLPRPTYVVHALEEVPALLAAEAPV